MDNEKLDSMKQKRGPRKRSDFPVEGFFLINLVWFGLVWFGFGLNERKWRERKKD